MASTRGMVSYQGQGHLHCDISGVLVGRWLSQFIFNIKKIVLIHLFIYIHIYMCVSQHVLGVHRRLNDNHSQNQGHYLCNVFILTFKKILRTT